MAGAGERPQGVASPEIPGDVLVPPSLALKPPRKSCLLAEVRKG